MTRFDVHSKDSAPKSAKPLLDNSEKALGFVPNLHGVLAESPEALEAYQTLTALFSRSSLSDAERNVVWMTINVENACLYCVPAHSAIAKMQGLDDETIAALRDATPLKSPKLEALRQFTLAMLRQRGKVADVAIEAFLAAGYTKRNALDVALGVAHKTLSNYVNHLAGTPVDEVFSGLAWTP